MADYFLTIDGMDGGSFSRLHRGAFTVSDFNFDISNLVAGVGSGAGQGKPVVAPLSIDIAPGSYMDGLLKAAASGQHIKSVMLQGDLQQAGTFYDLRLEDVMVTRVIDSNGVDKLQLSYRKVSVTERQQKPDGSLAAADVFSFNVATGETGTKQLDGAVAGAFGSGGNPADYFLHVDGVKGTSTSKNFAGDFNVESFDFRIFNTGANLGSGSGQGKASFSPLTVMLENGSPLNGLLKMVAQGKHVPLVELRGADLDLHVVYDLKLTDAAVTKVNNGRNFEKVQFSFSKIQLTTWEEKSDGTLAAPETFSWNLKANAAALHHHAERTVVDPYHGADAALLPSHGASFVHDSLLV